jgi:hypothetical protein
MDPIMKSIVFHLICSTAFSLCSTIMATNLIAQQPMLFGGHGIRTPAFEPDEDRKTGLHWPKLSDFSTGETTNETRFRLFGPQDESTGNSEEKFDAAERRKLFGGMPLLFSQRDPSEPNFIDRMNAKSKDLVDRTTTWAQQKNQNLRERTFDTWDSITKDLRPTDSKPDERNGLLPLSGAQPPVRASEDVDGRPRVRF